MPNLDKRLAEIRVTVVARTVTGETAEIEVEREATGVVRLPKEGCLRAALNEAALRVEAALDPDLIQGRDPLSHGRSVEVTG